MKKNRVSSVGPRPASWKKSDTLPELYKVHSIEKETENVPYFLYLLQDKNNQRSFESLIINIRLGDRINLDKEPLQNTPLCY